MIRNFYDTMIIAEIHLESHQEPWKVVLKQSFYNPDEDPNPYTSCVLKSDERESSDFCSNNFPKRPEVLKSFFFATKRSENAYYMT